MQQISQSNEALLLPQFPFLPHHITCLPAVQADTTTLSNMDCRPTIEKRIDECYNVETGIHECYNMEECYDERYKDSDGAINGEWK
jgi:hypothetical protein